MSKITSLSIYLENGTDKDFLKESYGKVIDNIQSKNISSELKNQELSGDINSGSVEAKRFENAASADYGTARAGGKGANVKARPVTVALDTDKEIIEEVEDKDVALYGVEGFIERRLRNHEMVLSKELERAFFNEAVAAGSEVTLTATDTAAKVDEAIVKLEKTKNKFVNGVDRMYMTVVADPQIYTELQSKIDTLANPNVNSASATINEYHGCRIKKSTDLPANTDFIVMVDGSVAQPVRYKMSDLAPIPMSNAYSFGIFYSYGTKAVAPDLILVAKSAE